MALSTGPSVERMVNRQLTSAGSPHRSAPSRFSQAGQSRNIIMASVDRAARAHEQMLQPCDASPVDSATSRGS
jgi:hypothetical protein